MPIHPTAVIDQHAEIDPTAEIGAYAIIDGHVKIGAGVRVYPHAYITGWTEIGERCQIHPSAVVGHLPQDFNFKGDRSYCRIGAGTIIREGATVHRGTQPESWTILGKDCFLLAYSHVAHNCELGNGVKLINNSALAGHVIVGDNAIFSAHALVHQFVRIGEYVLVGPRATMLKDVPPFMKSWHISQVLGYNAIGMRRSGLFSKEDINEVRKAYKMLFREKIPMSKKIDDYAAVAQGRVGARMVEFLRGETKRGICGGRSSQTNDEELEGDE